MAYGLKLFYEWTSFDGVHNKVEVRDVDLTDDTSAVEVTALGNCFEVEYPNKKLGYESIRSCGAKLYFEYKGDEGFLETLFTPELKKYKVIHYIESAVNFLGYLNTELYDEDFSRNTENGVQVNLTANNGLSILKRINYRQEDGEYYYGFSSLKDLLSVIINDGIGLEYQNLYFNSLFDLMIDGAASTNYLDDECINNANWIDEDGDTETLYDVLENILVGNGVQLITIEDDIYILPINTQAKASATTLFNRYTISSFTKQSDVTIDLSPLEIMAIGYDAGGGQRKSKLTSINSQEIEYDPYFITEIVNGEVGDEDDISGSAGWNYYNHETYPWYKYMYNNHVNFNRIDNADSKFIKAYLEADGEGKAEYYLEWTPNNSSSKLPVFETKELPIYIHNNTRLKISVEAYFQTAYSYNNQAQDGIKDGYYPTFNIAIKSGGKYLGYLSLSDTPFYRAMTNLEFWENQTNRYDNKITFETEILFNPNNYDGQPITLEFCDSIFPSLGFLLSPVPDKIRIYSVKCEIVDSVASNYNIDVTSLIKSSEIQLDSRFKNKGKKIELRVGTLLQQPDFRVENKNQRGAFVSTDDDINYTPITAYRYNTINNTSEYWVLNQILSNYSTPSTTISCKLKKYNILKPVIDSNFIGSNVKMIATGGVFNYFYNTFKTTLQEVKEI